MGLGGDQAHHSATNSSGGAEQKEDGIYPNRAGYIPWVLGQVSYMCLKWKVKGSLKSKLDSVLLG